MSFVEEPRQSVPDAARAFGTREEAAIPELTVSMPAYNAEKYIKRAIESVLNQERLDLELIVVDDGSTDHTADIVASFQDARVRLLRNSRRMGIGYCHNVVLRESRSSFIAHVDADDFLMPGALRTMIEAIQAGPDIGQAHCYFFDVDEQGKTTREAFYNRWTQFRQSRTAMLDYKANLLHGVNVINHLRTYRKAVLEELGGFNEKIRFGVDYEMALRLIDRYSIKLAPEFLYCRRIHRGCTTESLWFKTFRFWAQMYWIRKELLRRNEVRFLTRSEFGLQRLIHELIADAFDRMKRRRSEVVQRAGAFLKWRIAAPMLTALYRWATNRLSGWPLAWRGARTGRCAGGESRLAYYLWFFPVLSETFIQREIAALRRSGLSVEVLAHQAQNQRYLDACASGLMENTHYIKPVDPEKITQYMRGFVRGRPLTLINLFLHVLFCRYDARKSFSRDIEVFKRAVCLAAILEEQRINHVHAPWASMDAFVAQVAARLLNIRYTVQGRAYDIHRNSSVAGLPAKLATADLVITNARYNESVIRPLLPRGSEQKLRVIYEGIDLDRFRPASDKKALASAFRILSVANLVEAKGLEYLIMACKLLKDRGLAIKCQIIGSWMASNMNCYIALQKLRRDLALQRDVTFIGAQSFDRVLAKYEEVDVFVLPSVIAEDGSGDVTPNVLIEAMAMKLPVVSTRSRGIPELVEDGVSGVLVEPRDAEALAQAIARLAQDEELRARLGSNARERVEQRFDVSKNIAEFARLFRGLGNGRGAPSGSDGDCAERKRP